MSIKTSSAKAKGRNLQNKIRDSLRKLFKMGEGDIDSAPMGISGEDIKLSPAARKKLPISIECKNQVKLSIPSWIEQAKSNSGNHPWWLIFRHKRKDYVVVEWQWLEKQLPKIFN